MKTLELVIYTVKPERLDQYLDARHKMRKVLSQWDGFVSGVTFQSLETKTKFVDYYLWRSLDEALKAAKRILSEPAAQDFLNCIGEVTVSHHFEIGNDQPDFTDVNRNSVFEVAVSVVDPDKQDLFRSTKPELFTLVRKEKGLEELASVQTKTDDGILNLDVLHWRTLDASKLAMERIHKTDQCQTFMTTFKADVYFDHMSLFAN